MKTHQFDLLIDEQKYKQSIRKLKSRQCLVKLY